MHKNEDDQTSKVVKTMATVMLGGILALGICLIILFLCSIGVSNGWLSDRAMIQYTIGGCVVGGFFGAEFSVLRLRYKTLIIGFLTSCIQILFILSIGYLLFPSISLSGHGAGVAVGCIAGGLLAGFLIRKPKKKRRK